MQTENKFEFMKVLKWPEQNWAMTLSSFMVKKGFVH